MTPWYERLAMRHAIRDCLIFVQFDISNEIYGPCG